MGWDIWSLTPAETEQGSQYLTVTLFETLEEMIQPVSIEEITEYMQKAHPNMSEKEINAMMDKTTRSRDIAHQVYLKQIYLTEGDFEMKIGTVAAMRVMKPLESNYERAESTIFKPWHHQQVNDGKGDF